MTFASRSLAFAACAGVLPVAIAAAQTPRSDSIAASVPSSSLFRQSDGALLGGAFAASAMMSLYDRRISQELSAQSKSHSALRQSASVASAIGGAGPVVVSVGAYLTGTLSGRPRLAAIGREATTAVLAASALTLLSKGVIGRERPVDGAGDPDVFHLGHGFSGGASGSFPSGHTSASFALATVLLAETPADRPHLRWAVGGAAFGAATLVGAARVYGGQHWTSDVISGAALGVVSGWMAVRYAHRDAPAAHLSSSTERLLDRVSIVGAERGAGVSISFR